MNADLKQNYGFVAPMFIEYVMNHQNSWDKWRKMFRDEEIKFAKDIKDPIAARLAEYMAVIKVTAMIMHEAIPGLWPYKDDFSPVWHNIADNAGDATSERAALQYVLSWVYSNAESFEGREVFIKDGNKRVPSGGWAGKWESSDDWSTIDIFPNVLNKVLEDGGFNPNEVLLQWRELGWIDVEGKSARRFARQVRMFGKPTWGISIKRDAADKAYGDDSSITDIF